MRFRDKRQEIRHSIEGVCLILSLGSIFFQIWILSSALESYLQGKTEGLLGSLTLSFIAFLICALTAWTTGLHFMKGSHEGRTPTYHQHTKF